MKYIKSFLFFLSAWAFISLSSCDRNKQSQQGGTDNFMVSGNADIDALTKQILENPNNASLYAQRGTLWYDIKNYEQAAFNFEKAISLDSTKIDWYQQLADAQLDRSKSDLALLTLQRLNRNFPDSTRVKLSLAELELILMRYEDCGKTISEVLKKDETNPDGLFLLGMMLKETGDTLKAMSAFQKAVENNSDFVKGYIQLGLLSDMKNSPFAIRYYENALRIDTSNYDAMIGLAQYYQLRNQYVPAENWYRKMVLKFPHDAEIPNNLGLLYLSQGKYDLAVTHFNISVGLDPTYAPAYYHRGWIYEKLGKKQEAIAEYRQTLAFDPDYTAAKEALAKLGAAE